MWIKIARVSCLAVGLAALAHCSSGEAGTAPACTGSQVVCGLTCVDTSTNSSNCGACGTACAAGQSCVAGKCGVVCPSGETLCGDKCVTLDTDEGNCGTCGTACPAGQVCSTGKCDASCATGYTACGSGSARFCANVSTDVSNCGACGTACTTGEVCTAGKCGATCSAGTTLCTDGKCHDLTTDNADCGACGTACGAGEVCSAGKCGLTCGAPLTLCSGGAGDAGVDAGGGPYCANTKTDRLNCGGCGVPCAVGKDCVAGTCATSCGAGLVDCGDGICRDLSSDLAKCGSSCATAVACVAGQVCSAGSCASTCASGTIDCGDGRCRDLSTDNAKCGTSCATAIACPAGTICSAGSCASTCTSGTVDCGDGRCRDLSTDRSKCGTSCATAVACGAGQICSGGACVASCGTGLTACSGVCTNTSYDPANCGACGTVCATGMACFAGSCRALAGASKLYLSNWDGLNTNFNIYDIAKATWSPGPPMPVTSRAQITTTGPTVRMYGTDNFVYEFTPATGTWTKLFAGPTLTGLEFFEWLNGNMYLCQAGSTTLNVHNGTSWSTVAMTATCSIAGGTSPATKEVYVKTYGNAGFTVISATSNTVLRTITDPTVIAENTSSAAYLAGSFYTRSATGDIFALNGITGTRTDTLADPGGSYPGFVADPNSGVIYMLSSSSFKAYKPGVGFTTLTTGPNEGTLGTITITN